MRILYLECSMGASGEKLAGALSELTDQSEFIGKMNRLGFENIEISAEISVKRGIRGSRVKVTAGEEEGNEQSMEPVRMKDIRERLDGLRLSTEIRKDILAVYEIIAEAQSRIEGIPSEEIQFYEIGTREITAYIAGVCILMDMVCPDKVVISPVAAGTGKVRRMQSVQQIPSPVTAEILRGIPFFFGGERGELCTPEGAALLKYFADSHEPLPMTAEKIGYGMGTAEYTAANCLRAFLGEVQQSGKVTELVCNLDDMTPEEIGFAQEILMEEGALDVYTTSVYMKKNRPGWVFTCMCRSADKERMTELIFRHTTTLGIREIVSARHALRRSIEEIPTSFGNIRIKKSEGFNTETEKLEYEDLAAAARKTGLSIREIRRRITREMTENDL